MKFSIYIALRYFFSKKNKNAINIITGISVAAFAFTVAATVIILSGFNGFSELISKQISLISPHLEITPKLGKTFDKHEIDLTKYSEIQFISEVLEENVLLRADDKQKIAVLKGVDTVYKHLSCIDTIVHRGHYLSPKDEFPSIILSYGVMSELNVAVEYLEAVSVWVPNSKPLNVNNPQASFNDTVMIAVGALSVDAEFDSKYAMTDIAAVRELTGKSENEVSALEIKLKSDADIESLKSVLVKKYGKNFHIKNNIEQNETIYRVMRSEKTVTFLILIFVIILAAFSIVGAVSMLIIEKKENIQTLQNLGASRRVIMQVFLISGMVIAVGGGFVGLSIGGLISRGQETYGWLKFPTSGSFIVEAYPVEIQISDFLYVTFGFVFAGFFTALYPVLRMKRMFFSNR